MDLKTIARFRDVPAAQLAQSRLEADGIEASLLGVNHVSINWLVSQAIGGIRLQVPAEDAEHARELLQQDRSEDREGVSEADLPAAEGEECPRCGSDRVSGVATGALDESGLHVGWHLVPIAVPSVRVVASSARLLYLRLLLGARTPVGHSGSNQRFPEALRVVPSPSEHLPEPGNSQRGHLPFLPLDTSISTAT